MTQSFSKLIFILKHSLKVLEKYGLFGSTWQTVDGFVSILYGGII